jgi:hypothetical protein
LKSRIDLPKVEAKDWRKNNLSSWDSGVGEGEWWKLAGDWRLARNAPLRSRLGLCNLFFRES